MIRKSLRLAFRGFSKSTQDARLTDSYQLSETEIAAILGKPVPVESVAKLQPEQSQLKQLTFGLPKKNEPFPLCFTSQELQQVAQTPTQNLYEVLQIDGDSSIHQYLSSMHEHFRNQLDLYGDETVPTDIDPDKVQFKELIKTNSQYLLFLRKKFLVNSNLPGTIQLEDANNFLTLRPIQEFRHTPLIPISQSTMRKFKQEMQERHNKAFYLAVKTETLINVGLFIVSLGVVLTLITQVRKGSDKKALEVMRLKHRRATGGATYY